MFCSNPGLLLKIYATVLCANKIALLLHDTLCWMTASETLVLQVFLTESNTHAVIPRPTPLALHHRILPFPWLPALQSGSHHTVGIIQRVFLKAGEAGSLQCTSTCSWRGSTKYSYIYRAQSSSLMHEKVWKPTRVHYYNFINI